MGKPNSPQKIYTPTEKVDQKPERVVTQSNNTAVCNVIGIRGVGICILEEIVNNAIKSPQKASCFPLMFCMGLKN